MKKHTPTLKSADTPWELYEEKKGRFHLSNKDQLIALVFEKNGRGNAWKIQCAVNVHEELIELLRKHLELPITVRSDASGEAYQLFEDTRKAIAKAEGL